jgi:CRP-like cAMP-binding protein
MAVKNAHDKNCILARLPAKERAALYRRYETVTLALRQNLYKAGKQVPAAYFPESGMISLVQSFEDGTMIEVGLTGSEGFLGVPLVHGAHSSPVEATVQGEGTALRIPANDFLAETERNENLRGMLLRYAEALLVQVMQSAACNGRHTLQQRTARWLLEASDRMGAANVRLSHETIAYMLGCRRSGVTVALGALQATGVLDVGRSRIRILNRKALEIGACECYRTVQNEFRRLLS